VLPAELVKGSEDQWVPLDPVLREALLALPRQGRRVFRFQSPKDGHEIGSSAVSDRVRQLAKHAGVPLTMHALRKGFGCRYAAEVPAQVLQRLMRHASIRTTMDFYVNTDQAAMDAVLRGSRNSSRNSRDSGDLNSDALESSEPPHSDPPPIGVSR